MVLRQILENLENEQFDDFKDVDDKPADHPLRNKVAKILTHV